MLIPIFFYWWNRIILPISSMINKITLGKQRELETINQYNKVENFPSFKDHSLHALKKDDGMRQQTEMLNKILTSLDRRVA